eukprot:scaffold51550_cov55-Attheya_sp.AAC.1
MAYPSAGSSTPPVAMLLIGWGVGASYINRSASSEGDSFQRILGRLCDMFQSITNDVCVPVYSLLAVGYLWMIFVQQRKNRRRVSLLENEKEVVPGVEEEALWNEADNFVDDEGGGEVGMVMGMVMVDGKAIQVKNMSGRFLLVKNEGFEEFLAAQGVPWALRKAANKACPLHHLTHVGNK